MGSTPTSIAHRRLYAGCMLVAVVFAATATVPSICLPALGEEFSLDLASRGLIASLRMAVLLGALLLSGFLAARYGKAVFLVGGCALTAVGMAGTSAAPSYALLLAAQVLVGVGTGAIEALMNPLTAELHPRSPGTPLNIVNFVPPRNGAPDEKARL